jgi:hypothetical protein
MDMKCVVSLGLCNDRYQFNPEEKATAAGDGPRSRMSEHKPHSPKPAQTQFLLLWLLPVSCTPGYLPVDPLPLFAVASCLSCLFVAPDLSI